MKNSIKDVTGAYIVLLLRNRIANDWVSLCRELGFDPNQLTLSYFLLDKLKKLRMAGLIEYDFDRQTIRTGGINGQIVLSENWEMIQVALGISLADVAELKSRKSIVIKPYYGKPHKFNKIIDLFVLMPFEANLRPVYDDHITNVVKKLGLTVARADDFFTSHSVMSDIWAAICKTRAIIADCTGRNTNVFYEIGLAHAIGKPVVLITQNKEDVPFDLRHIRYIRYEFTPRGMELFERSLANTLKTELDIDIEEGS